MKKYVLFIIASFLVGQLFAQITIEFTPNPVEDWDEQSGEVVGHALVKNTSDVEKTFLWKRIIQCNEGDFTTLVCDKNFCYTPQISEKEFILAPDEEGTMDLHIQLNDTDAGALVYIEVTEVGNDENTVMGEYIYQSCTPSNSVDLEITDISAFPNPTEGAFKLTDNTIVDKVVVYNIVGKPMKTLQGNQGQIYDIAELPAGLYLIRLSNKAGDSIKTIRINKI